MDPDTLNSPLTAAPTNDTHPGEKIPEIQGSTQTRYFPTLRQPVVPIGISVSQAQHDKMLDRLYLRLLGLIRQSYMTSEDRWMARESTFNTV